MGILDDAIKEHLELKRQHGADQSELKKLEDEAFGASERPESPASAPDPLAEAPTQFMAQPELEAEEAPDQAESAVAEAEEARSEAEESPEAEAPPEPEAEEAQPEPEEAAAEESAPSRTRTEIADLQEPPVESVEAGAGPSTEERHSIAEQPTEMYDVEAELGDAEPEDAEPEVHALSEEQPLSEEDEEFWDEKRLSDELDQALEAPAELREPDLGEPAPAADEPSPASDDPAPAAEEPSSPPPRAGHEDALDETPEFLEDKPEDDQLWFEQKPPKDFDFDD
jgi:hypothetical protein